MPVKLQRRVCALWHNVQRPLALCATDESSGGCSQVVKAVDCDSTIRGFNPRHSPISCIIVCTLCYEVVFPFFFFTFLHFNDPSKVLDLKIQNNLETLLA